MIRIPLILQNEVGFQKKMSTVKVGWNIGHQGGGMEGGRIREYKIMNK